MNHTTEQLAAIEAFRKDASGANYRVLRRILPHMTVDRAVRAFHGCSARESLEAYTTMNRLCLSGKKRSRRQGGGMRGLPRYLARPVLGLALDPSYTIPELDKALVKLRAVYSICNSAVLRPVETDEQALRSLFALDPIAASRVEASMRPAPLGCAVPPAPTPVSAGFDLVAQLASLASKAQHQLHEMILQQDVPSARLRVFARRARMLQKLSGKPELLDQLADQYRDLPATQTKEAQCPA